MRSDRAKQQAWERILSGELSNDELSVTIAGFQLASPTVLRRYEDAYFAGVAQWWDERSMEIATRMVRGLYPRALDVRAAGADVVDGHRVVRATQRWLEAHGDAPAALRRIMTELLDEARRSVDLQARCLAR